MENLAPKVLHFHVFAARKVNSPHSFMVLLFFFFYTMLPQSMTAGAELSYFPLQAHLCSVSAQVQAFPLLAVQGPEHRQASAKRELCVSRSQSCARSTELLVMTFHGTGMICCHSRLFYSPTLKRDFFLHCVVEFIL